MGLLYNLRECLKHAYYHRFMKDAYVQQVSPNTTPEHAGGESGSSGGRVPILAAAHSNSNGNTNANAHHSSTRY